MTRPRTTPTLPALQSRCIEEGDCWLWQGGRDGHGRPAARHRGVSCNPRRLVRELVDGKPIPSGRVVAARCGQKLCISPACSVIATNKQRGELAAQRGAFNSAGKTARMMATKRAASRYSDALIEQVRHHPGPSSQIAAETGMSASHVKAIRRGESRVSYATNPWAGLMG